MSDPLSFPTENLAGALPAWHGRVSAEEWKASARQVADQGGRLIALWGSDWRKRGEGFAAHAAYSTRAGLVWITLALDARAPACPDVSAVFPAAARMQRAMHDLLGIAADGARDTRAWLRHGAWPADAYPLRHDFDAVRADANVGDAYRFVEVEGEGVHEIAVGPVHAGTIEPGHFRFSVLGERLLRLEERLGYKHKGIEKRFERMAPAEAGRLAGRISGDSTAAYAWAFAMAIESAAGVDVSLRARWLRALCLERERVANHLGDLGALGNDAGLAFGLAQFSRLKEDWLRGNEAAFGHRYLMDVICAGGLSRDLSAQSQAQMRREAQLLQERVAQLKTIYDDHAGLQDRFINCGRVAPELAARLGLSGLPGRASAQALDLRCQFGPAPYDELDVRMATHRNGDVAARVTVRFEETLESLRLIGEILERLPAGEIAAAFAPPPARRLGVGWIEGWRGEVLVALETGVQGQIERCHAHDPSWQNWPLLEHAVIGNIVPDFPLINKSFNLSYAGHDL